MVVIAFLSTHMIQALLAFGAATLSNIGLGLVQAKLHGEPITLQKLPDFIVTTVGWQHTLAFAAAIITLVVGNQPITEAAVAAMAALYTGKVLDDDLIKIRALQPAKPA